jgi:hypothetical protein
MADDYWRLNGRFAAAEKRLFAKFGLEKYLELSIIISSEPINLPVDPDLRLEMDKNLEELGLPERPDSKKVLECFHQIEAGLSKSYKHQLEMVLARTDINLEWMSKYGDLVSYIRCFA